MASKSAGQGSHKISELVVAFNRLFMSTLAFKMVCVANNYVGECVGADR